jgi:PGF-CTERM protein
MQYFSAGEDAFKDQDAEEGIVLDYVIIDADWIDYSECDTENTAAFGIDRGNNNSGTQYDEDLVQHREDSAFRDDGITVDFYDRDDLPEDPPYLAPEDAIVAEQGENSAGGGCLSMTDEEGWYRHQGFANGTVADNGPTEEPSENAGQMEVATESTWFYICDCESEEEAREELGPPPGETADSDGGGEETPEDEEEEPETPSEETPEETATPEEEAPEAEETVEEPAGNETATEDEGQMTSEAEGDGPGFGPVMALVALLAAALFASRRR